MPWFDGIDFVVEVAFDSAPLSTSPVWTDITGKVRGIDSFSGSTSEYTETGPGRLTLVLDNNDRRFDPEHDGPYAGRLVPGKRVRARYVYSSVSYPLFDGFVLGWPQETALGVDETVRVTVVDGFRYLGNRRLSLSAYGAVVLADSPIAYWPMQEPAAPFVAVVGGLVAAPGGERGVVATEARLPVGAPSMVRTADAGNVIRAPSQFTGQVRTVEAWVDFPELPSLNVWPGLISVQAVSVSGYSLSFGVAPVDPPTGATTSGLFMAFIDVPGNGWTGFDTSVPVSVPVGLTHVAAVADGSTVRLYLNGTEVYSESTVTPGFAITVDGEALQVSQWMSGADSASTLAPYVNPVSAPVSHVAVYSTALSPTAIRSHYVAALTAFGHPHGERGGERIGRALDDVGWPTALRDLSTGDTFHGPYIPGSKFALDELVDVRVAEDGVLFMSADGKVTFRSRSWSWSQTSKATFADDGTGLEFVDVVTDANSAAALRNEVAVSYAAGQVTVRDQRSIEAYGATGESLSAPTIDLVDQAQGLARYRVRTRKSPRTRIDRLLVRPRSNPATLVPAIGGLAIGDIITVKRTPRGVGSPVAKKVQIRGISHRANRDGGWDVELSLSPAPLTAAEAPYWTLGDPDRGRIGPVAQPGVVLGSAVATTSGSTLTITTTSDVPAGALIVVRVAADNLSGTTPTFTAACPTGGVTFTTLVQGAQNTTAAAGVAGAIIAGTAAVDLLSGTSIVITLSGAVAKRVAYAEAFRGVSATLRAAASTAAGTTNLPSVAAATVSAGDLVVGAVAFESNAVPSGYDTDTTNGSWSAATRIASDTGTATSAVSVVGQSKIVTAAGAQTFNQTLAAATDWRSFVVVLVPGGSGNLVPF